MNKTSQQPRRILGWMECLADATRLRLLWLLEQQELGVTELCEVLQMPQSTVSRHLKLLADQNWVLGRRQGTNHLYRMILDEIDPSARRLWIVAREQTDDWATLEQDKLRLSRLIRHRDDEAQTFFAGAAGQWDKLRDELYGRSFITKAIAALLPAKSTIADLGCGTGSLSVELAQHVHRVIGIDNSQAMLRAARRRAAELSNLELRRGELTALPIDNHICDAAVMILVLTYSAQPQVALKEVHRILKPGGTFVMVDLLRHDREDFRRQMGQQNLGFETEKLQHDLLEVGFDSAKISLLSPEPDAKGPALLLVRACKK